MDTTLDGMLNRRVQIEQPADGYRIAMDTVFLAAAVPAKTGQKVLDFGCGVGGAMLCLAARVPGIEIIGVDIQRELVALCQANIERNKMPSLSAIEGDATVHSFSDFDHVMMNPPYHEETRHDVSEDPMKRKANSEREGNLALWVENAARALKDTGILTLIHRADRLDELIRTTERFFGGVEILPLVPKDNAAPKRAILRAYKNGVGISHCHPIVLHEEKGGYTDEAESILRHAKALEFI